MKTKYLFCLLFGLAFYTQAQTTHFINWEMSVGANATITVDVGDTIEWENVEAGMPHDVTSSDPNAPIGFGSGQLDFGDTYSFTFNTAVVFDYGCGFHPGSMDGTITVVASGGSCDEPSNITLDDVTDTTAEISWDASPDETDGYNWAAMQMGDNPETDAPIESGSVSTSVTMVEIIGLTPNTMYDVYVQTNCGSNGESSWEGPLHIMTEEEDCDAPTNITEEDVTATTATISWTSSATETNGYAWAVFNGGDDPETDTSVTNGNVASGVTIVEITGLDPDTNYDFYVLALCDNGQESDITGPLAFTTAILGVNDNTFADFTFYPNPASGMVYLEAQNNIAGVVIFNLFGQEVISRKANAATAMEIDISVLASGSYLLKVILTDGKTVMFNMLKK